MKTTVLAIVLACALAAGAQDAAQTPPAAGGGQGQGGPTITNGQEYNAYIACVQPPQPLDAAAKATCLEAFLTQYPNTVMKTTALELLMGSYLQVGNAAKVTDTAKRLLTADACNLRALAVLTSLGRQAVQGGQTAQLADLGQYSSKGLDCVNTAQKPATINDPDWATLKKQVAPIFEGGSGFAKLQNKDYAGAATDLQKAVEAEQNQDPLDVYYLGFAYLSITPPEDEKMVKGVFFIARAANLASGAGADQIRDYGRKKYKNYHGSEDGWNGVLFTAKSNPLPPAGFAITKYIPPTPAQQAHDIVNGKTPDQIKQLSFGEWELVLSAGSPEDQDKVWSVIKGVPLQMEGNVIASTIVGEGETKTTQLQIAASEDDIEKKQADITITMTGVIPAHLMPKSGDTLDFQGTPVDYTSPVHTASAASAPPASGAAITDAPQTTTPPASGASAPTSTVPAGTATTFMMTMEKGALLKKAGTTPTRKPPVHHRTTTRKPQ